MRAASGGTANHTGPDFNIPAAIREYSIDIKDVIADAMLQQILTRPKEYSVVATLNLNGAIQKRTVNYDFERQMAGATLATIVQDPLIRNIEGNIWLSPA